MSEDRPDGPSPEQRALADDRTVLAAERNYASWLRTGLAFLGSGLAAQRFLQETLPVWQLRVLVFVLIGCAVASFSAAGWRDARVRRRIPQPEIHLLPRTLTLAIAALLVAISGLAAVALWFA